MIRRYVSILMIILFLSHFLIVPEAKAATMDEIIKRLDKLEQENKELRAEVNALKSQGSLVSSKTPGSQSLVTTKSPVGVKLYGFVEASGVYSDSAGSETVMNAPIEADGESQKEYNFTARGTRLGLDFSATDVGLEGDISGKVEMDFFGGSEGTPSVRMRHAYAKLNYPDWNVLAGQTWDVFAPLNPSNLNRAIGFRGGNLGHRHPQLIVTRHSDDVLGGSLDTSIGLIDIQNDAQEKRGVPLGGGYIKYENKTVEKPYSVRLGGVWGEEKDTSSGTPIKDYLDIWAATVGLTVKLTKKVNFTSEVYSGANLAAFRSTNNSSVDGHKSLRSRGGFAQFTLKPTGKDKINVGSGVDDVKGLNQVASTNWIYNCFNYVNYNRSLSKNLTWGVEYQHFKTKYINSGLLDKDTGHLNRFQTSFKYAF